MEKSKLVPHPLSWVSINPLIKLEGAVLENLKMVCDEYICNPNGSSVVIPYRYNDLVRSKFYIRYCDELS